MTEVARTIKMKDELLKERVLEKFEIEREYWQRKNIDPLGVVLHSFIICLLKKSSLLNMLKPLNLEQQIDIKSIDESKLKKVNLTCIH